MGLNVKLDGVYLKNFNNTVFLVMMWTYTQAGKTNMRKFLTITVVLSTIRAYEYRRGGNMFHSTGRAVLSKFHYSLLCGSAAAAGPPLTG